jgi:hypothetical protein
VLPKAPRSWSSSLYRERLPESSCGDIGRCRYLGLDSPAATSSPTGQLTPVPSRPQ